MMERFSQWLTPDRSDLLFRLFFSLIFLGVGAEHLFADDLLQRLMPLWVPAKRLVSIVCGVILISGGAMVLIGYQLRKAAVLLGAFLIVVTVTVHLPALLVTPSFVTPESSWLWTVLQRSNFAKNLCLLGVCFYLYNHTPGKYSWTFWRQNRHRQSGG